MRQIEEINIEDVKALQKIAIDTFYETFKPYYTEENLQKFFEDAYNIEKLKTELNNPESFHYFLKKIMKLLDIRNLILITHKLNLMEKIT